MQVFFSIFGIALVAVLATVMRAIHPALPVRAGLVLIAGVVWAVISERPRSSS